MGKTLSDIHQKIYYSYLEKGLSHKKAMKSFPKQIRKKVEIDINKDPFESHFGVSIRLVLITFLSITITLAVLLYG